MLIDNTHMYYTEALEYKCLVQSSRFQLKNFWDGFMEFFWVSFANVSLPNSKPFL